MSTLPVTRKPLSRVTALALTKRIRANLDTLWDLLLEAYERKAHAALGYETWQAYVAAEFDISRGQSYRLIDQARVTRALQEATGTAPEKATKASRARDKVIQVSAREAAVLKPQIEEATAEIAEAVKAGATPIQAVKEAVAKRMAEKKAAMPAHDPDDHDDTDMTAEEFDAAFERGTPAEVLTARPIPAASRLTLTRGDVMALVSHVEETNPTEAARLLSERELMMLRRWIGAVVSARQAAKPLLEAARQRQAEAKARQASR